MAKQFEDFDANLAGEEGKTEETKTTWFRRIKKGINTKTLSHTIFLFVFPDNILCA